MIYPLFSCVVSFFSLRGQLLKIKVIVIRKDCHGSLKHVLKVVSFPVGFVRLLGNEAFLQRLAVIEMEAVLKDGIPLALGYSPGFEKGLAERVEVAVVVDYVDFFFYR